MKGPESRHHPQGVRHAILLTAILSAGVILRTISYAALGSMWVDELYIALNVTRRPLYVLFTSPLAFHQVAPIGFLAAEKLATVLFGVNEAALRLFPYLTSLASLLLFWRVATRFLVGASLLGAVAIFAASPTLLWLARNAKQYSGDVAVTLLLILLALRIQEARRSSRKLTTAAVLGGAAILFSQPAVIVALVLLVVLLIQQKRSGEGMRPMAIVVLAWTLGAALVSVTSLILSPLETREFMREGWSGRGFLPLGPEALLWIPHRLLLILGLFLGQFAADRWEELTIVGVFGTLAAIGLPYLVRRVPGPTALLFSILGGAILFSAARVLPLSGRVSLYVAPVLLVMAMAGTDQIRAWLPRDARAFVVAGQFLLAAIPTLILILFAEFPIQREESKIVLERLRHEWHQGDVIYVIPAAENAMEFYGRPLGFDDWYAGSTSRHTPRNHLTVLDSLRGNPRVWFFYSHAVPCHQQLIRSYLETIGVEVTRIEDPRGNRSKWESAAYLYDLSDPARLGRSNARVFPVPDRIPDGCGDPPDKGPWVRARDRLQSLAEVFGE